ncbi:MAG: LysE family transporter [Candidatus Latescibacterota bacterium]
MFAFLLQTVLISLSGVMAPGPITAVTIGQGNRSPHAGAFIAAGHGIVEFPLMAGIFFGAGALLAFDPVKAAVFALGGIFLFWMGAGMLRSIGRVRVEARGEGSAPLVEGILLSLWNPYFLLWWATVGATLITRAVGFGVLGFILFALAHWLCDLIWLYFLSAVSFKGGHVFGIVFQKVVFGVCGVFLLFFGGKFLLDAARIWF